MFKLCSLIATAYASTSASTIENDANKDSTAALDKTKAFIKSAGKSVVIGSSKIKGSGLEYPTKTTYAELEAMTIDDEKNCVDCILAGGAFTHAQDKAECKFASAQKGTADATIDDSLTYHDFFDSLENCPLGVHGATAGFSSMNAGENMKISWSLKDFEA